MTDNFTSLDDLEKKRQQSTSISSVSHSKEAEPGADFSQIKEVVEHEMESDVKEFISPRSESIKLPPDLKKMGLQQATTTKFPSYQNIKLPISDDKVMAGTHAPVTSSLRWLATLALYLLSRAHLGLKTVHGKVVRIIKT